MKTLRHLGAELKQLSKQIDKLANDAAVSVAFEIVKDLAYATPVDTSNALSNWKVSIGKADLSEIEPHFPGILGDTKGESAAATVDIAREVLTGKKPGQPIFISNVVDYLPGLNAGKSRQAPAHFIENSVLRGTAIGLANRKRSLYV